MWGCQTSDGCCTVSSDFQVSKILLVHNSNPEKKKTSYEVKNAISGIKVQNNCAQPSPRLCRVERFFICLNFANCKEFRKDLLWPFLPQVNLEKYSSKIAHICTYVFWVNIKITLKAKIFRLSNLISFFVGKFWKVLIYIKLNRFSWGSVLEEILY